MLSYIWYHLCLHIQNIVNFGLLSHAFLIIKCCCMESSVMKILQGQICKINHFRNESLIVSCEEYAWINVSIESKLSHLWLSFRAILSQFTEEQMSRYESFRRSGFQKANMKKVSFFYGFPWLGQCLMLLLCLSVHLTFYDSVIWFLTFNLSGKRRNPLARQE